MNSGVYIVVSCVLLFMDVISIALLIRVVLSWMMQGEQSAFERFVYVVTEPIIMPVRALCERFGWFQGLPFDMPFFIATLLLLLLRLLLEPLLMI